jgi:hypothetical protein
MIFDRVRISLNMKFSRNLLLIATVLFSGQAYADWTPAPLGIGTITTNLKTSITYVEAAGGVPWGVVGCEDATHASMGGNGLSYSSKSGNEVALKLILHAQATGQNISLQGTCKAANSSGVILTFVVDYIRFD